jgi:hypothetical protein
MLLNAPLPSGLRNSSSWATMVGALLAVRGGRAWLQGRVCACAAQSVGFGVGRRCGGEINSRMLPRCNEELRLKEVDGGTDVNTLAMDESCSYRSRHPRPTYLQ